MGTNEAEVFHNLIVTLLSDFWVVLLFGLVYFAAKHYRWINSILREGPKKKHKADDFELMTVVHGVKTMACGVIIVALSYSVVALIYFLFPGSPNVVGNAASNSAFWLSHSFEISVISLMVSGYCLILSAGGRWLTYVAKIIATLSILFLLAANILTYLK